MTQATTETWTAKGLNPALAKTTMRKRAAGFLFSRAEAMSSFNSSGMPPVAQFVLHVISRCRAKLAGNANAASSLRLVSQLPLGGKKNIALVEADGVRFLVGGGADCVTIIVPVIQPASSPKENAADIRVHSVQKTREL